MGKNHHERRVGKGGTLCDVGVQKSTVLQARNSTMDSDLLGCQGFLALEHALVTEH